MELDRTRITIHERSLMELLDLSLKVFMVYWRALALLMFVPSTLLTAVFLYQIGWMASDVENTESVARYVWVMTLLVFLTSPLVSVPATMYLGRVMFMDTPRLRNMIWESLRFWLSLTYVQLFLRGTGLAFLLLFMIEPYNDMGGPEWFLVMLCIYAAFVRSMRPFVNEIIVLERNPLRGKTTDTITVARRSQSLHTPNSGDLLGRWIASAAIATLMASTLVGIGWFAQLLVMLDWHWGRWMVFVWVPTSMRITAD